MCILTIKLYGFVFMQSCSSVVNVVRLHSAQKWSFALAKFRPVQKYFVLGFSGISVYYAAPASEGSNSNMVG